MLEFASAEGIIGKALKSVYLFEESQLLMSSSNISGKKALAADVGGTHMRVALVDGEGRITRRHVEDTQGDEGPEQVMDRLTMHLKDLTSEVPEDEILGLGLGVAGPTDSRTGVMFQPPNLQSWHGFSPKDYVQNKLGIGVVSGNDANLAALGEHRFGLGKGLRHLLYLTVSTGVGGGIIVDRKLYEGRRGYGGELGHISIGKDGPPCACGSRGCLESLASGTAIARIAKEALSAGRETLLRDLSAGDLNKIDTKMVAHAAREGDGLAEEVMSEAGYNLGMGLATLLNVFDPEIVVLGGGVSNELDVMMPQILRAIEDQAMGQHKEPCPIVQSSLGDDVGLIGAAALVFDHLG